MKTSILKSIIISLLITVSFSVYCQDPSRTASNEYPIEVLTDTTVTNHVIAVFIKNSSFKIIGTIIQQTDSTIILKTKQGTVHTISKKEIASISDLKSHKNAIKTNLLSPLLGCVNIEYERSLTKQISVVATFGYIGTSEHNDRNDKGYYLTIGGRYFLPKTNSPYNIRNPSSLQGWYFSPSITYLDYTTIYEEEIIGSWMFFRSVIDTKHHEQEIKSTTLALTVGHQFVINMSLVLDFYLGPGVTNTNKKIISGEPHDLSYHYAYIGNGDIVFKAGFKVGFVF